MQLVLLFMQIWMHGCAQSVHIYMYIPETIVELKLTLLLKCCVCFVTGNLEMAIVRHTSQYSKVNFLKIHLTNYAIRVHTQGY